MAAKEKVLVVNDEPCIRRLLRTLLEVYGFDVQVVSGGVEALAKINAGERPEFVILDILMPEMGGIETLEKMMYLDRKLKVVMTSCFSEPGTIIEAFRLGARDYLVFPFDNGDLVWAMRRPRRRKLKQILKTSCWAPLLPFTDPRQSLLEPC